MSPHRGTTYLHHSLSMTPSLLCVDDGSSVVEQEELWLCIVVVVPYRYYAAAAVYNECYTQMKMFFLLLLLLMRMALILKVIYLPENPAGADANNNKRTEQICIVLPSPRFCSEK